MSWNNTNNRHLTETHIYWCDKRLDNIGLLTMNKIVSTLKFKQKILTKTPFQYWHHTFTVTFNLIILIGASSLTASSFPCTKVFARVKIWCQETFKEEPIRETTWHGQVYMEFVFMCFHRWQILYKLWFNNLTSWFNN